MKISGHNSLKGIIKNICYSSVSTEVLVSTNGGEEIFVIVPTVNAVAMKLDVGDKISAVINPMNVLLVNEETA